ncbi:branched-chain amino acid ABC transporter permease [Mesorhizobium sp. CAU 1741]|uniref:branched-chain amino acid ABC transporter permease n=1 Tax=Mesorhizobium sp. CAU 1741 TaxID=3140366 RepID=UPI00325A7BD0
MNPQVLIDGLISGSMIGLGAIGLTLVYSILRFPNFAHGELITWGAYFAMSVAALLGGLVAGATAPLGPFSFGWGLIVAAVVAMGLTAVLALALDTVLFKLFRQRQSVMIIVVMASFGASMALRSLLEFIYTARPGYFTRELQIAMPLGGGMRATPDQLLALAMTGVLVVAVHLLLTRTPTGRAMRAVSENPGLAGLFGVDVDKVIRTVWILGAALACAAGIIAGLLVQIRPYMGFDLLLPLFAAAILGGIGSVPGAILGGLIVGLGEALAVQFVGAQWRAGVAFFILIAILLVRPTGIFGRQA